MRKKQMSEKRRQAIDGIIDASSRAIVSQTTSVSLFSDPMSWAVVRAIANCSQIISRWVAGTITGKFALRELINEAGGFGGAMVGMSIGGAIGTLIFPVVGTAIGAALGGFGGYWLGRHFASRSTAVAIQDEDSSELKQDLYETALEEFGLDQWASNQAVESNKRYFSLKYHPDKNPGNEDWAHTQFCRYMTFYSVIKAYRVGYGMW